MSDAHEKSIKDILPETHLTGSSGNKSEKNDVVSSKDQSFSVSLECKSTTKKSYSLSLETWNKTEERASSQWRRPGMPIRFYLDEELKNYKDLIVLDLNDFAELMWLAYEND
jgi:hypothetical protein